MVLICVIYKNTLKCCHQIIGHYNFINNLYIYRYYIILKTTAIFQPNEDDREEKMESR